MIHVDVKRVPNKGYDIQTSTDGAGWKTQYHCALQVGVPAEETKREAEFIARVFKAGCEYAGAQTKGTSCGYNL